MMAALENMHHQILGTKYKDYKFKPVRAIDRMNFVDRPEEKPTEETQDPDILSAQIRAQVFGM